MRAMLKGRGIRQTVIWQGIFMLAVFVLAIGSACYAQAVPQDGNNTYNQERLKKACLSATITAINLEISRHQQWIDFRTQQGDQNGLAEMQEAMAGLKADLEKYRAMDVQDYVLPEKVDTVAWVGDNPGKNSILYVEGMSRNGPWYHLAGIVGDNYTVLQPKKKYQLSFYKVYSRSYGWMDSAYVCVAAPDTGLTTTARSVNKEFVPEAAQGKRITGEVFKYSWRWPGSVECENYQVYLLKDNKPGAKGQLILEAKESRFDITLTETQLKQYSYMEFDSKYGRKTISISDIKDEPLEIMLGPDFVARKPAIYLYPVNKTPVTVVHKFKGRILNTYPAYGDNWTVIAEPNGDLLNVKDNRYYKYLFWDGEYSFAAEHYKYKAGFYVGSADYVSFLQSKLAAIGLNENEINDFIVYWLPIMNNYKNCFIHFRINDDIDGSSMLETKPGPDTVIRVFMEFAGVDDLKGIAKLPEQKLPAFARKGFTLVEWGGAEIGKGKLE